MRYELATISCPLLAQDDAVAKAREWVGAGVSGETLGIWKSDIGPLGQVLVLRRFADDADLARERDRALAADDSFGVRATDATLALDRFARFPFLPEIAARDYGGVFEFRTYWLKPGGLPPTLAGWQAALGPAQGYTDHLVVNMYALDGPQRITHIWGFSGVDERIALRRVHYADGSWPPKGGPEQIDHAMSIIAFAEPGFLIA